MISKNIVSRYKSTLKCKVYLPDDYYNSEIDWPLVLFLHGSGERGSDFDLIESNGIPKLIMEGQKFPFVLIVPQCPLNSEWIYLVNNLKELLNDIVNKFRVNVEQISLTGLSMGGHASYALASATPGLFSAMVVICGWLPHSETASFIKTLPIWHIHGEDDPVVPVNKAYEIKSIFSENDGDFKLTIYENVGHNAWEQAYDDKNVYEWLLRNRNIMIDK